MGRDKESEVTRRGEKTMRGRGADKSKIKLRNKVREGTLIRKHDTKSRKHRKRWIRKGIEIERKSKV